MALSTLGADLWVAPAATGTNANVPPTTGWKSGWGEAVTDFPGFTSSVNTIDVTPIIEDGYVRYVSALSDTGGAADITINIGKTERELTEAVKALAATSPDTDVLWFAVALKNYDKCFVFKAMLGAEAVPALTPNSAFTTTISITPNYVYNGTIDKPTDVTPLLSP